MDIDEQRSPWPADGETAVMLGAKNEINSGMVHLRVLERVVRVDVPWSGLKSLICRVQTVLLPEHNFGIHLFNQSLYS
ncbi:hypothetical protein F7R06_02350 [Pseudomonas moorei]|nr:hypothetical protein F7R06_02350 [Pseudomonas moorei]